MNMIGDQGPRKAGGLSLRNDSAKALQKASPVIIGAKYFLSLDSPNNNMLNRTGRIYSSFSWHACALAPMQNKIKHKII
ncbi:MAG: hypothetical protein PVG06_04610, partial [Desulfobacterales bacterium]